MVSRARNGPGPASPRIVAPARIAVLALSAMAFAGAASAQIAPCRPSLTARPASATPAPAPANESGCQYGVGLVVGSVALFRCQATPGDGETDIPEGAPEYVFLLDRPGRPRLVLPDDLMAGRLDAFEVVTADLDGDGREEHVLAAWNAQGNGIGVNRWTVRVFDDAWAMLATYEDVSDWGDSSLVVAPSGRPGCDLAITRFVDDVDSRGREGVAFEARFQRLEKGAMVDAADRPVLTRRYTFAFEAQRTAHFRHEDGAIRGDVAAWLSHASTRRRCDQAAPLCGAG